MAKVTTSSTSQRKQPSQRRSRARVATILQATRDILESDGLAALTTASIAARAGVPVGSIYQYFPNKQAIFVALYTEYLDRIHATIESFRSPQYASLTWRDFFTRMYRAILREETRLGGAGQLLQAMRLYPELLDIDEQHGRRVAQLMVAYLRRYGPRASTAKLERLCLFSYEVNSGIWHYQAQVSSGRHQREAVEWEIAAFLGIIATVLD